MLCYCYGSVTVSDHFGPSAFNKFGFGFGTFADISQVKILKTSAAKQNCRLITRAGKSLGFGGKSLNFFKDFSVQVRSDTKLRQRRTFYPTFSLSGSFL